MQQEALRPGAETSVPVSQTLPPPAQHRYEPGIVADNEENGLKVGETLNGKGGQQAQKEKERKVQAETDAEQARQRAELERQQKADEKVSTQ